MSQVIVPTIGRKIWLWLNGKVRMAYEQEIANGIQHPAVQPMDASICRTFSDHMISVTAASGHGYIESHQSVELIQAGEPWDEHTGKHCQWMPFQVSAAAKHEPPPAPLPPLDTPQPNAKRELDSHKINGANQQLRIEVMDEPGAGGACHHYTVSGFDTMSNPANESKLGFLYSFNRMSIVFQNGTIPEAGVNGVTHEALLAVLIDRLESFQLGAFANDYNAIALAHLHSAQSTLLARTRERMARGVEGTHTL